MLNKCIMFSNSKTIVIPILTKIILIMIFPIIEQPYTEPYTVYDLSVVSVFYCFIPAFRLQLQPFIDQF